MAFPIITAQTVMAVGAVQREPFPPFDTTTFPSQLIWLALTFGFLYYMMKRHLLPRIEDVIAERENSIKRDLAEAERLKSETDAALAAYEKALAEAKSRAFGIAKTTRESLAAETDKERQTVEVALLSKINSAELRIANSKAQAMASVNQVAAETAAAIVNKLTGKPVSGDDVTRAVADVK